MLNCLDGRLITIRDVLFVLGWRICPKTDVVSGPLLKID